MTEDIVTSEYTARDQDRRQIKQVLNDPDTGVDQPCKWQEKPFCPEHMKVLSPAESLVFEVIQGGAGFVDAFPVEDS
jgi:hypothetical protein